MITKFKIEGEALTKEELAEEMATKAGEIMKLCKPGSANGHWECTDDVSSKVVKMNIPIGYKGRMSFMFKRADERRIGDD